LTEQYQQDNFVMTSNQQKNNTFSRVKEIYQGRPQALLFLGISYALWASVSLRWITEFIEHKHPWTPLIIGILLLYGLAMGIEPLFTHNSQSRGHIYIVLQLSLTISAMLFFYELDFFAILLLPITGQTTYMFSRRIAGAWITVFMLANLFGQIHQFGWPEGLSFIFLYTAAILFIAAFSIITIRSQNAQQQSEALLAELQEAHKQLQTYAGQAEELAISEERNRLARELHDSVAQTLYGLTLQSEAANRRLKEGKLDKVADDLVFFQASTQQTLQEIRLLIFELRPPELEEIGLAGALQERISNVERRSGISIELDFDELESLSPKIEISLYRIALEALNNILKHARANRICLSVKNRQKSVWMEIEDDGLGFDMDRQGQSGLGLQSMRERVSQMHGEIKIQSAPGQGTVITVEAPK
jgi:signal transduction histidine kinase